MSHSYLSNIRQEESESLTLYLTSFQNEQTKIADASEEYIQTLLTTDVRPQNNLWKELQKEDHVSLGQFYKMAAKHMRVESSLEALSKSTSSNRAQPRQDRNPDNKWYLDRDQSRFQKKPRTYFRWEREFHPHFVKYTSSRFAHSDIELACEAMRLPWSEMIKISMSKSDPKKYYWYHRDIDHDTNDRRAFKDAIKDLIWWGYLKDYVAKNQPRDDHNELNCLRESSWKWFLKGPMQWEIHGELVHNMHEKLEPT